MRFSTQNDLDGNSGATDAELTLRLIAALPAPQGIEERVKSGVRASQRQARVVAWPDSSSNRAKSAQVSGLRAAAAAAIVFVVAGGGWEVYSHIRVAPVPTAIAAPQRIDGTGGFSAAGAKRTPKTLDGPKVVAPVIGKHETNEGKADLLPHGHVVRPLAEKSKSAQPARR